MIPPKIICVVTLQQSQNSIVNAKSKENILLFERKNFYDILKREWKKNGKMVIEMNAEERRKEILTILKNERAPLSGTELAGRLNVSRQVIVQDIALLRAVNKNILSTNKGYLLFDEQKSGKVRRSVCVCHKDDEILDEFFAVVDCGGRVLDVVVEHEIYGQITVDLIINNRQDAVSYMEKTRDRNAKPLNILTNGVHYHTIEADSEATLDRIEERLKDLGIWKP